VSAPRPDAVVIGGYVNGLGVVRALAARGVATAVVRTQPFDIAHLSRLVAVHDSAPGIGESPELLVDLLERRAPEWEGAVLFPTNDEALAALALDHQRLSSRYRIAAPSPEACGYLLDKRRMRELAEKVGLDLPRFYGPADDETAARTDLSFPVVIKPLVGYRFAGRFGSKLFVANDLDELRTGISRVREAGLACEVFDLVPGGDDRIYAHCTYVDEGGEPSAGVTVRKLRQAPPLFGDARVAEIAPDPADLREPSVELVRRMGLRGTAVVEFKHDPRDGRFRFIEVNGRSVVYNRLLRRAGLDLAALAWSDHVEGRPEPARPTPWPGVWIHLHADLLYSLFYRRHPPPSIRDFLAPYRRPRVSAVWSPADPLPFAAQWSHTIREGASRLLRGTHRERLADRASVRPE
jgi:predicted ATP-grasp superfamily ATP-dependent carboligase